MRLTRRTLRTITAMFALAGALTGASLPAVAQADDPDELGTALVDEFVEILKQPDDAKRALLADFLADEYQIVRSNGVVRDKADYIANPSSVTEVEISDMRATLAEDVLVLSYTLRVDEILDGVVTKTVAPRLSVFHLGEDGRWRIAAHANFGALDAPATDDG